LRDFFFWLVHLIRQLITKNVKSITTIDKLFNARTQTDATRSYTSTRLLHFHFYNGFIYDLKYY